MDRSRQKQRPLSDALGAELRAVADQQLNRNEFYKLAHECRDYALRLANHDQDQVSRDLCREFNEFRTRAQAYDRLRQPLAGLRPARPITRPLVMSATLALWFLASVVATRLVGPIGNLALSSTGFMLIVVVLLIPPRFYGTSVEAIEGRVLAVVSALQNIMQSEEMEFTEAAYFAVRDVLREASDELRQQVYLSRAARR